MRNGQLYALGVIDVAFGLLYNEAVLSAHKLAPPTTTDEWLSAVQAVTKAPSYFGTNLLNLVADGSDWWNQLQNFCLPSGAPGPRGPAHHRLPREHQGHRVLALPGERFGGQGRSPGRRKKLFDENRVCFSFNVAAGLSSFKKLAPAYYPHMRSVAPPWPSQQAIERLHPLIVNNQSKYIEEGMALVKYILTPQTLYGITVANGYPIIPYTNFGEIIPAYAKYLDTIWLKGYEETKYVGEFQIWASTRTLTPSWARSSARTWRKRFRARPRSLRPWQAAQAQAKVQLNL